MATLIEQLQEEALDPKVSLTDLLRKTKLCAAKLGLRGAVEWVDHELNGYPAGVKLPDYRQLSIGPETVQVLSRLADSIQQSAAQIGLETAAQAQLEPRRRPPRRTRCEPPLACRWPFSA
jgi:hypothetical protein